MPAEKNDFILDKNSTRREMKENNLSLHYDSSNSFCSIKYTCCGLQNTTTGLAISTQACFELLHGLTSCKNIGCLTAIFNNEPI